MNISTAAVLTVILILMLASIRYISRHGICDACERHGQCQSKEACRLYDRYMSDHHPERLSRN